MKYINTASNQSEKEEYIQKLEFRHKVVFDPLDYGLAVSSNINFAEMDHRILQVFGRFYNDGWIHNFGDSCFFISHLLKRILRLHGIEAHTRQVVHYYSNQYRGWQQIIGEPMNITHAGAVDSHSVVITKDYILDFAVRDAIHYAFGMRSPIAFIGENKEELWDNEQDFGEYGSVVWQRRRNHRETKNIVFENRESIIHYTKEYFKKYVM